jgi:hypothetical protein
VLLTILLGGTGAEAARQPPLTGWLTFGNGLARRLALVRGGAITSIELPAVSGRVLVRSLSVRWPQLAVRSFPVTDAGRQTVRWRSLDGGESWTKAANDVVLRRSSALSWPGAAP